MTQFRIRLNPVITGAGTANLRVQSARAMVQPSSSINNNTTIGAVTQAGTWTVQPGNTANTTAWKVDGSAVTQPVSGTFFQATQPVSGTFFQATQPVSIASTVTVAGAKTNDNAAPGATNIGALTAIANAAAPTWTEANLVGLSVDLAGNLRTSASIAANSSVNVSQIAGTATAVNNGVVSAGVQRVTIASDSTGMLASVTTVGTVTTVTAVTAITNALPTGSNTIGKVDQGTGGASAWKVDGSAVTQPVSIAATVAVAGVKTNNAAVPGTTNIGTLGAIANAAAPTWVEANQVGLSVDLAGNLRTTATIAANSSVNVAQIAGTATAVNNGAASAGTQRVTIANDSTGILASVTTVGTVTTVTTVAAVTAITNALPTGANTIGKVDQGTGGASAWKVDGSAVTQPVSGTFFQATQPVSIAATVTVAGAKTNNAAVPGATNVGVLGAIANAAAPTWVEANQVGLSVDLSGNLRTSTSIAANSSVNVNQIAGTTTAVNNGVVGAGVQRVTIASDSTGQVTLATGANTIGKVDQGTGGASAWKVDGSAVTQPVSGTFFQATQPVSIAATVTVAGAKTNNGAAPGATNIGTLGAIANAAAPTWTEANQVGLSVDLAGNLRTSTSIAANSSVNVNQIAGTTTAVNNGVAGAGVQRVTIASDSTGMLASVTTVGTVTTVSTVTAVTAITNALPTGANTIGKVDQGTGGASAWKVDGSAVTQPVSGTFFQATQPVSIAATVTVAGAKTNDAAAPGATNVGALTAVANAAAPTWTETNLVALSVDLAGNLRTSTSIAANSSVNVNQIAGTTTSVNNGVVGAGTQRVTIANDSTGMLATVTTVGTVTTVTAVTAITNALPVGANVIGKVSIDQATPGTTNLVALAANQSVNVAQINGVTPLMGNGASGTGAQRVTIANDSTGVIAITGTATVAGAKTNDNAAPGATNVGALTAVANAAAPTWTETNLVALSVDLAGNLRTTTAIAANSSVNVNQIAGTTTAVNNGVVSAGVQRVTIASDSTGQVTLATGANTIGALTANQSVNQTQVNGVAVSTGNGVSGTGVQRFTLASDSTGQVALAAGTADVGKIRFSLPTTDAMTEAVINFTATGDNTIVTLTAAQTIRVHRMFLVANAPTDVIFKDATGGTSLTGAMTMTKGGGMTFDLQGEPWFTSASGGAFVINQSGTAQISGRCYYTKS
jgi:hypothetical protein